MVIFPKSFLMKKLISKAFKICAVLFLSIFVFLYMFQEKLIFFPQKLSKDYQFSFDLPFEEINIRTDDQVSLNGLLFKAGNSKGLIYYLHGNGGSLESWGHVAKTYTDLQYDVFMLDYRGYGKSEGSISSQDQMFEDVQIVYDELKTKYREDQIIVLGYSIGTGLASKVASDNNPKLLILQAPYFNLVDLVNHMGFPFSIIPTFIIRYKFETNVYIKNCKMPVVIFHGDADRVIYHASSFKLKELIKDGDTLIILKGQGHNGMSENDEYKRRIREILKG